MFSNRSTEEIKALGQKGGQASAQSDNHHTLTPEERSRGGQAGKRGKDKQPRKRKNLDSLSKELKETPNVKPI